MGKSFLFACLGHLLSFLSFLVLFVQSSIGYARLVKNWCRYLNFPQRTKYLHWKETRKTCTIIHSNKSTIDFILVNLVFLSILANEFLSFSQSWSKCKQISWNNKEKIHSSNVLFFEVNKSFLIFFATRTELQILLLIRVPHLRCAAILQEKRDNNCSHWM